MALAQRDILELFGGTTAQTIPAQRTSSHLALTGGTLPSASMQAAHHEQTDPAPSTSGREQPAGQDLEAPEGGGGEENEEEGEEEEEEVESNEFMGARENSVVPEITAPVQSPRLPNLAQAALQRLAEARGAMDSPDDFRPLKKRKIQETHDNDDDDQEGQMCSICFEPWSNSGGHRIASLRCGHLFGLSCIEKWLRGQGGGKCPQCNARAKKGDVRVIYAKAISVVDTTDRDRALKELEVEKSLRIASQKAEAQAILQHQLAKAECDRLKQEIQQLRKQLEHYAQNPSAIGRALECDVSNTDREGRYTLHKTITVSQTGGARVMAYDASLGMLVASKPSSSQLMPGYGLVKLSTLDLRYSEFVGVHSGIIRDAVFSPQGDGMVLTAGMDRCLRLTSMHSNTVVQSYQTPVPVWACAWNQDDPNYLYCGLQNGVVHVYDIRNTVDHVTQLTRPGGGGCPITSLAYVPLCRASTLNCSGLLVGSLGGGAFWEKMSSEESFTPHLLHSLPEGACTCLSFEPATRHCLASFRPSKRAPHSRHILCQLHNVPVDQPFSCQLIHQFTGGSSHKLLSRSRLFQRPGNDGRLMSAFGDEGSSSVQVWDVSSTSRLQQLSSEGSAALDITPFSHADRDFLTVLTESKLFVYQWQWV